MNEFFLKPEIWILTALFAFLFVGGIVAILYQINTGMRRSMKSSHDDARVEGELDGGNTLHAEGIYGRLHPEEPGLPLRQTEQERTQKRTTS